MGCFRKRKTNIVADKPPSDPCLLGQVTHHNVHLLSTCRSTWSLICHGAYPRVLSACSPPHRHTSLSRLTCPASCRRPSPQTAEGDTWVSLMLTLSIPCLLLPHLLHLLLWSYLTSSHTVSTPLATCFFLQHGASLSDSMYLRGGTIGLRPLGHSVLLPGTLEARGCSPLVSMHPVWHHHHQWIRKVKCQRNT